jgi:preprotein translocase subunit SecE
MNKSNSQIQTVFTKTDKSKLTLSGILVIAAIAAFYALVKQPAWVRAMVLVGILIFAIGIFFTSESGKALIIFAREAWRELLKVVWPSRKETLQMTGYVFVFVVFMAAFLWGIDKTIEWIIYDLLLRWKQ